MRGKTGDVGIALLAVCNSVALFEQVEINPQIIVMKQKPALTILVSFKHVSCVSFQFLSNDSLWTGNEWIQSPLYLALLSQLGC